MKLNKAGLEIYNFWHEIYCTANDELGGNSVESDFIEGWCIIDNYDWVKTLEDECGLWVYGYGDSAVYYVDEYIEQYGEDDIIFIDYEGNKHTAKALKNEMLKYFDMEENI